MNNDWQHCMVCGEPEEVDDEKRERLLDVLAVIAVPVILFALWGGFLVGLALTK